MKYYAGIGSRNTPADILDLMTHLARRLDSRGYTLRSGGADGADAAFERGAMLDTPSEFILCWTEHGSGKGGTGQALRIAATYNIPV